MSRTTGVVLEVLLAISLAGCSSHLDTPRDAQKKDAEGVKKGFQGSTRTLRNFEMPDTQKPNPARDQNSPIEEKKGKER